MFDPSSAKEINDESTGTSVDGEVGESEEKHVESPSMPPNRRIESVACGGKASAEETTRSGSNNQCQMTGSDALIFGALFFRYWPNDRHHKHCFKSQHLKLLNFMQNTSVGQPSLPMTAIPRLKKVNVKGRDWAV